MIGIILAQRAAPAGLVSDVGKTLNDMPTDVAGFWRGSLDAFFGSLATMALTAIVILTLGIALYGAIRWVTAAGDKEGLATARKIITGAIIGLMIALSLWGVMALIRGVFGIGRGGGARGGGAPAAGSGACQTQCTKIACNALGAEGSCIDNCRCICIGGKSGAYETPWCDHDATLHECVGGNNKQIKPAKKCP